MRLAGKLIIALMLISCVLVGIRSYVNGQNTVRLYDRGLRQDQRLMAQVLSEAVVDIWQPQGWEAALRFLRSVERGRGQVEIRWVWLDDTPYKEYRPRLSAQALAPLKERDALQAERSGDVSQLLTYQKVALKDLPLGAIELTRELGDREQHVSSVFATELYTTALLLGVHVAVAALLGFWLIGRPVDRLIEQVRHIGQGDYDKREDLPKSGELGELAEELLRLAARLRGAKRQAEAEREARLEVEDQLQHADRLGSVGRLTAGVIHDLGTPLNVISGRAAGIKAGRATGERAQDHARIIVEQSQRITEMIRRLLGFARRNRAQTQATELLSTSREILELLEPLAKKRKVVCSIDPQSVDVQVPVSRDLIEQVLNNLVVNAIQAMEDGGEVVVRVSIQTDEYEVKTALLSVRDEGPGISEDLRKKIFEPFFTTKEEEQGTGLGLSVCRQIVRRFGGLIELQSAPEGGACFIVKVPLVARSGDETTELLSHG